MNTVHIMYNYVQQHKGFADVQTELIRKSIHVLIAFVPLLAALIGRGPALALLAGGVVFYTYAEIQRTNGRSIPFITGITCAAARREDLSGKIILGPITLGIGAMTALIMYPQTASIVAIYALAFGDSVSSIIGKAVGRIHLGRLGRKTLEGSLACFFTVFFISFRMSSSLSGSCLIALTATLLEAVPVRDLDNIVMPMGSG
ncbi:MAG: phosphatidate cytidylyltransferase, partial [Spirochaetales bacterium]|nr:phosphatidate cytidylyltransferase [Spirochaetales bacterium]